MNLKRLLFLTVITSLSFSAFLGIVVFLFGTLSETEGRIIGTTFFVGIYSLSGLASFSLYEKKKYQILATANITFAAASFFMTELVLWDILDFEDIWRAVAAAGVIAYALAHISLVMLVNPKSNVVKTIQVVTAAAIALVAGILNILLFEMISTYNNDGIIRLLGVCAILSATGTILGPLINKTIKNPHEQFTLNTTPSTIHRSVASTTITETDLGITTVKHAITGEKFHLFKEVDQTTNKTELFIEPINQ